jgi:hypothetical protein
MIFQPESITDIVEGRKTQTRRVGKPEPDGVQTDGVEMVCYPNGIESVCFGVNGKWRAKWQVGSTYAVQPGCGKPGVLWGNHPHSGPLWVLENPLGDASFWRPLRIRLLSIRRERVQDISEDDARAEGWLADEDNRECPHCDALYPTGWYDGPDKPCTCNPVTWYRLLWDSINTKPGTRWADSPDVWALSFEVVKWHGKTRGNKATL